MSAAPTPHAQVSSRASIPPTGYATPALPAPVASSPELPPLSLFDIFPDLHKILKRVLDTAGQPTAATPTPAQLSADGPLEPQQVPAAATDIKLKIQTARRHIASLPDIDRTLEDQADEIEDLEDRIAQLQASLIELGRPVSLAENEDGDQSMTC